ncbi:hypothetical protein DYB31_011605 [Aphanomyces astaci]|uniref:Peptidase A2 domain-containing protein n=2 Tax=Aphanomyces astaci TaxID=112090 RepID=A0A397EWZ0_APHAT|nr:hypothetical protein DYB31_011605 [Aphanomyces astaci]
MDTKICDAESRVCRLLADFYKATTLLDSGAGQSVLSPTFLSRLEETGNFTSPGRQLSDVMELGGFMEGVKLDVDRDVKLRLTFETAEGTLVIANLKSNTFKSTIQASVVSADKCCI